MTSACINISNEIYQIILSLGHYVTIKLVHHWLKKTVGLYWNFVESADSGINKFAFFIDFPMLYLH